MTRFLTWILILSGCGAGGTLKVVGDTGDSGNPWGTRHGQTTPPTGTSTGTSTGTWSASTTGTGTGYTGTAPDPCLRDVIDATGATVQMLNEFIVTENGSALSGSWNPGPQEVLLFDFQVVDPYCPALTVLDYGTYASGTDHYTTNWMFDMALAGLTGYNMSTSGVSEIVFTDISVNNPDRYQMEAILMTDGTTSDDTVPGGSDHTFATWADTTGANSGNNEVTFELVPNSITVSDGINVYTLQHPGIVGGTFNY